MTAVVIHVVELNRRRHVELESVTLALAEAINAGEQRRHTQLDGSELEPVRELRRALAALVTQPLPEGLMAAAGTAELPVELVAPAHELEAIAEELERVADSTGGDDCAHELESLAGRLRQRALTRA